MTEDAIHSAVEPVERARQPASGTTGREGTFLSLLPAAPADRRLAIAVVLASVLLFAALAPFARVPLARVEPFIPIYESALVIVDLITAVLLFGQFAILGSAALFALALGYVFTSLMTVAHGLTFPGLFAPGGLLGAGVQSTAWIYMFWHAGFPLVVIAYALLRDRGAASDWTRGMARSWIAAGIGSVVVVVCGMTALATAGEGALPTIMQGNAQAGAAVPVAYLVWSTSILALAVLWLRGRHSVLDVWLMVVMCAWILDLALSLVLVGARFDLGFYAGRSYGLLAASFVLIVLLLETGRLYASTARSLETVTAEKMQVDRRHSMLVQSSPAGILSVDSRFCVQSWNPACERIFGFTSEDALGKRPPFVPEERIEQSLATFRRVLAGEVVTNLNLHRRRKDGTPIEISVSASPIIESDGKPSGATYVVEDVTERNRLQAQLSQAQKMEAVGQLTSGVAHDFNNLLTVIMGNLDMLESSIGDRPADVASLQSAFGAANRAAELTRQLLAFSRRQPLEPRAVQLNKRVEGMTQLLSRTIGEQIEIKLKTSPDLWRVLVDPTQLDSALANLAVNARDAMPDGGTLIIETANAPLDEVYAAQHAEVTAGDYVALSVSDTGTGMPPEVVARVFEPFFTTKAAGKGTGLGMSMVFGFIKQSGGHIKIYSEVGYGTTVRLYLPRARAEGDAMGEAAPAASAPMAKAGEAILLVEDEASVRQMAVQSLSRFGYQVLIAADGPTALEILDRGSRIDLLFTDLIMPGGTNGTELAGAARLRRPGLKILFTSGYTEPALASQMLQIDGAALLSKPYRIADLARKVRETLDRAP